MRQQKIFVIESQYYSLYNSHLATYFTTVNYIILIPFVSSSTMLVFYAMFVLGYLKPAEF